MNRKIIGLLIIGGLVLGTLLISGCIEEEKPSTESEVTAPIIETEEETPTSTPITTGEAEVVSDGWWISKWSKDGKTLKIDYDQKGGGSSSRTWVDYKWDNSGKLLEKVSYTTSSGTDMHGREWNVTVKDYYKGFGGVVKLTTSVTDGTVTHSAGFSRKSTLEVNYERDEKGILTGGSGSEVFSGSLPGGITYSGNSTVTWAVWTERVPEAILVWTKRVEQTIYYKDGKHYAQTITVTVPASEYWAGKIRLVRETERMTTTYADGSRRESEIVILYDWDPVGNVRKSGSGTVTGTEIVNGLPVKYTGLINITYPDPGYGWQKRSYDEKRSAAVSLLERLPFEVIFSNDHGLRRGFY